MKNSSDSRRQINNELKSRAHNQRAKQILEHHVPDEVHKELKIDFYCECSDDTCTARVPLTFKEFDKLHSNPATFVLAPGHHSPAIEAIKKKGDDYFVVEKYAL